MKNIPLIPMFFLFYCCKKQMQSASIDNNTPVKIYYNNVDELFLNQSSGIENATIHIRGYDFYQSRYVIPFDEENQKILKLYEKNNFKEITTVFSFSNLKKDTIYSFPITDSKKFSVFGNKYLNSKNGHTEEIIDVYFRVYRDKKLGTVAVIDSIR